MKGLLHNFLKWAIIIACFLPATLGCSSWLSQSFHFGRNEGRQELSPPSGSAQRCVPTVDVGLIVLMDFVTDFLKKEADKLDIQPRRNPTKKTISGTASCYGDEFQGKPTALSKRGEKFIKRHGLSQYKKYDKRKMTAACKRFPLGAVVKVTNNDNGESVVVRVTDHGPHVKGRIIDLSPAAFEELGVKKKDGLIHRVTVSLLATAL